MAPRHHALSSGCRCLSHQLKELAVSFLGSSPFLTLTFSPGVLTLKAVGGRWEAGGGLEELTSLSVSLRGQARLVAAPGHVSGHP